MKVGNQRAQRGVGYGCEEGTVVISLAANELTCKCGQRRRRLAKNGSESHFSDLQRRGSGHSGFLESQGYKDFGLSDSKGFKGFD